MMGPWQEEIPLKQFCILLSSVVLFSGCTAKTDSRPPVFEQIPGSPIELVETIHDDSATPASPTRGTMDIRLSPRALVHHIWNDPLTRRSLWGTITLKQIRGDGQAVIEYDKKELKAKPGGVFPGTCLYLVESDPTAGTLWIRAKFTHSVARAPASMPAP